MAALTNPVHEAFVQSYLATGNGTKSYLSIFPDKSYGVAAVSANRLLNNRKVKQRLAELQGKTIKETVKEVARAAARAATVDIRERAGRVVELRKIYQKIIDTLEDKPKLSEKDNVLLREAREYMKQAAIEQGQWTERQEHTVTPVSPEYAHLPPELLREILEERRATREALAARAAAYLAPPAEVIDVTAEVVGETPETIPEKDQT